MLPGGSAGNPAEHWVEAPQRGTPQRWPNVRRWRFPGGAQPRPRLPIRPTQLACSPDCPVPTPYREARSRAPGKGFRRWVPPQRGWHRIASPAKCAGSVEVPHLHRAPRDRWRRRTSRQPVTERCPRRRRWPRRIRQPVDGLRRLPDRHLRLRVLGPGGRNRTHPKDRARWSQCVQCLQWVQWVRTPPEDQTVERPRSNRMVRPTTALR